MLSFFTRMNISGELTRIGVDTNTDKAYFHNFTAVYERFLYDKREKIQQIIEIGVLRGSSIQMWERYLPNAKILGLDVNPQYFSERTFGPRVSLEICDATKESELTSVLNSHAISPGSVDFIIEDGSHIVSHQVKTMCALWKYVKPGGFYVIEDMHTAVPSLIGRHSHIPHDGGYIDMNPTTETRVLGSMYGFEDMFPGVPLEEIEHIAYVSTVKTKSLTCIFTKK
jgi:hypothetical protein